MNGLRMLTFSTETLLVRAQECSAKLDGRMYIFVLHSLPFFVLLWISLSPSHSLRHCSYGSWPSPLTSFSLTFIPLTVAFILWSCFPGISFQSTFSCFLPLAKWLNYKGQLPLFKYRWGWASSSFHWFTVQRGRPLHHVILTPASILTAWGWEQSTLYCTCITDGLSSVSASVCQHLYTLIKIVVWNNLIWRLKYDESKHGKSL